MDGVAYPYDIVKFAEKEGMPAVAITDYGCILGFPEFEWAATIGQCEVKPLFGIEAYVVNDYEKAVYNYKGQDITKVVAVDIETTGFSAIKDEIIEISGVKICNGEVEDRFNILVNPGINIPRDIEKLTGITNEMVLRAPYIENAFIEFSKFAGNNVLIAYDTNFAVRFLKAAAIKAGVNYDPAYIDTKMLCRYLYPDFQRYTLNSVCKELEIDIDPYCCTVDYAVACGMVFSRAIERLKNEDVDIGSVNNIIKHSPSFFTMSETYHCTVLLKNPKGKKIIYNLISQAEQNKGRGNRNVFSLWELCNNRNNLLLGSGCEAGLLFRAIIDDKSEEEVEEIARCFDFIEVQPHMNNKYMLENPHKPHIQTEQDLIDINLKLILLGERLNIPVVATGDVHYLSKEDSLSRNVLRAFQGFVEDDETDLHFRTTKEMLKAFSYLPEDKEKEIVITNTNRIADMCELISFLPEGKHYPVNEDNSIELRKLCERKLVQTYKASGINRKLYI